MPILWQSGEPLQITAKLDEFQKSFSIEHPSEINKALLDLRDIQRESLPNLSCRKALASRRWQSIVGKGTRYLTISNGANKFCR